MISFAIGKYHSDSSVESGSGQERGLKEPDDEATPAALERWGHRSSAVRLPSIQQNSD